MLTDQAAALDAMSPSGDGDHLVRLRAALGLSTVDDESGDDADVIVLAEWTRAEFLAKLAQGELD